MNCFRKEHNDTPKLEVGNTGKFCSIHNVPLYVHFSSCTIKLSKQTQALNLQDVLIPVSREITGSKILFEYLIDTVDSEDFNTSLDLLCSNKERVTICNPSTVEFAVVNREPNRYMEFVNSITKWLLTLSRSFNELVLLRIDFCKSGRTKDEMMRDVYAQYVYNCLINDGWFLIFLTYSNNFDFLRSIWQ